MSMIAMSWYQIEILWLSLDKSNIFESLGEFNSQKPLQYIRVIMICYPTTNTSDVRWVSGPRLFVVFNLTSTKTSKLYIIGPLCVFVCVCV